MQDQYEDITTILARYPEITSAEDDILKEWINQSIVNQKIFEDLTSPDELLDMVRRFEQIETGKRKRWQRVLDDVNTKSGSAGSRKKIFWLQKWQTYAAAASVIIIVSLLIYIWQAKKTGITTTSAPTVAKVNDVNPGKYKARLTLADGTEIILDSMTNKVLAQQGGIRIINKDGRLVYEKTGNQNEVLYNTLSTSKGETYVTELSDGTKVWLNSQSSIRYPVEFNGDVRKVEITGEAYFEVAPSFAALPGGQKRKRHFVVSFNGTEVEVLGTHFNINSYADEPVMKTTLLEGKVKVRSTATNEETILQPGEQAQLNRETQALNKTKDVDVDAEVAWRFGMFQFNDADLKTVMRQLERWYDVEVEYSGKVPEREFVGVIPRSLKLSKVLSLLQKQNVHFKIDGKKIIVTP